MNFYRNKKRKTRAKQKKIRTYGNKINEETRAR